MPALTILATLTVLTAQPVSSDTAAVGDAVSFTLPDSGETAHGSVIAVQKRRNRARDGELTIQVRYIARADGSRTYCVGQHTARGRSGTLTDIAALGAGGLFIKGGHAVIDAGTPVTCETE